jgi:galactofuranosylgalactofuranosylrhamnosyl-N-acetylglucosaminyl-diphospho-decaprenol beta-1,5/1,6-galactofuranosyltransferase
MSGTPGAVVAHAVFPVASADEVLALYVDGDASDVTITGRRSITVRPGGSASLGSYFNAFPAAYWQAETGLTAVRLRIAVKGAGTITVLRSDADARPSIVEQRRMDAETGQLAFDLPLSGFDEGGVYWFDLTAAEEGLALDAAEWSVDSPAAATATVAMATFNRPVDCLAQLRTLADDADMGRVLDRIVVADQGTDLVSDQPGFDEVAARLGKRLVLVRQPNMGGSGGFSRGMLEALERAESDAVLLLDDDAISEPEAIFRAIRFGESTRRPVIVGGGMLHLDRRSVLYAQSEQWDEKIGWVRLDRPGAYDHDFSLTPFRYASFFHRRERSDFNGWWMCLIPRELLQRTGLSLPLFLKGDDVEFALRAREHGTATVSPPGIALWHMGWGGKAPTRTWEAYFLHRNRLITELMHTPWRRPTGVLLHSFLGDVKPLLTLQYSAVRLRAVAIADVLAGPERLPDWLSSRAAEIRALWSTFTDAVPAQATGTASEATVMPVGRVRQAVTLARVIFRHLTRPASAGGSPQARVAADQLGWWTFAAIDSALVDTADGRAVVRYQRSRRATVRALRRSIGLHLRLWWQWPGLAREFRDAGPALASPARWAEILRR